MSPIEYKLHARGDELDLDQVIEVYVDSTLGERRPVDRRDHMQAMMKHANLVVSAWDGALLVGLARSLSDFAFITYCSDLAVRAAYQRKGIGKELLRRTQEASGPSAHLLLLAAPAAVDYYPHIGFTERAHAFMLMAGQKLRD